MGIFQQLGLDPKLILSQAVSFVVVYLLLRKFLFGPIGKMIQKRNEEIGRRLTSAEEAEAQMIRIRSGYEERIAQIETEARDRIQEAIRMAHEARDEIIRQGREQAEKVLERARREIELEKKKALLEIREHVAEMAVLGAEKILRSQLDEAAQRRLVEQFIEEAEHLN